MDAVRKIIEQATNPLTIELPAAYHNQRVEVIVLPLEDVDPSRKSNANKYDFSDLAGKLMWQGDPVAEQRKLRDEWD